MIVISNPNGSLQLSLDDQLLTLTVSSDAEVKKLQAILAKHKQDAYPVHVDETHLSIRITDLERVLTHLVNANYFPAAEKQAILNNSNIQSYLAEQAKDRKFDQEKTAELEALVKTAIQKEEWPADGEMTESDKPVYDEQKFASAEHRTIGNRSFKQWLDDGGANEKQAKNMMLDLLRKHNLVKPVPTGDGGIVYTFYLENGAPVSVGDLVALGGDFAGIPEHPIAFGEDPAELDSAKEARFKAAFASLQQENKLTIAKLTRIFKVHSLELEQAIENGEPVETVFHELNRWYCQDIQFTRILGLKYLKLALHNEDHFGDDARTAYRIGLKLAQDAAIAARDPKLSEAERAESLALAWQIIFYACHFLTDLFSAGHVDTPRRLLVQQAEKDMPIFSTVRGSLDAMNMHEEDNQNGVFVVSDKYQEPFKVFGDDYLLSDQNAVGFKRVVEAVQAACEDVFQAYKTGNHPQGSLKHIPRLADQREPMYKVAADGKTITPRADVQDGRVKAAMKTGVSATLKAAGAVHHWTVDVLPNLFRRRTGADPATVAADQQAAQDLCAEHGLPMKR